MKSRSLAFALVSVLVLTVLTGCWDNEELTEYGFVQAVAIDQTPDGKFQLTTHFYSPTGGAEMRENAQQSQNGINIRTRGHTIFEAVRDIPIRFGRKAKWDHMRVILIGERVLQQAGIGEILDYFSRDHEPRGTILPLVAEGTAGSYLEINPFIEHTIGQQLKRMETDGADYSAKTSKIPLFELAIQMKSATGISTIPYIHHDDSKKDVVISGVALLKDGKLVRTIMTPEETQGLVMLTNNYKFGVVEYPCPNETGSRQSAGESFEVLSLVTKLKSRIERDEITVNVSTRVEGTVGELVCTEITNFGEEQQFEERIRKQIEKQLRKTIAVLQQHRLDAIGIGNQMYRKHPALWKTWKSDWGDRFADIRFQIAVDVRVLNTGMNVGTPFGRKDDK